MTTRALTMLNTAGDVTIIWEADSDDAMEAIIAEKMKAGCSFFIIEPRFGGLAAPARKPLKDAADARKHRALAIPDEDLSAFVGAGAGALTTTPNVPAKTVRRAKTAKEAAQTETVGVQARRGG
ncbi:MAG: hypothetical protein KDJ44_09180 [Rhodoblastus sp.]|nr:hypothetical protein [Rhodoblastus sp.]